MPLVEEVKGYEFKGRTPAGRCIVEEHGNEGKLSVWVQDLKPQVKYGVFLIFAKEREYIGFPMGSIEVGEKGKGELKCDIAEVSGFAIKDVTAAAIIATDAAGVVSPLCGYQKEFVTWRFGFKIWEPHVATTRPTVEAKDAVESLPEKIAKPNRNDEDVIKEAPVSPEAIPPSIEERPPPECTENMQSADTVQAETVASADDPVESGICSDECPQAPAGCTSETGLPDNLPPSSHERIVPPLCDATPEPCETRQSILQLLESIFNANTPFKPFAKQKDNLNWVRCAEANQMPLPSDNPHLMSEPFMLTAWADHEHFILGISETNPTQYVIGIPGKYSQDVQPHAQRLGFNQFKSCKNNTGYWLMTVDF